MKSDIYTKAVLTVIAVMLTFIACKSAVQPLGVAAEGPLAGVQFVSMLSSLLAIDTRTGELWSYGPKDQATYSGRIVKLGEPLDLTARKK